MSLPLGELDRDAALLKVLDRDVEIGGLEVRRGRLVVEASGEASAVGARMLRTFKAGVVSRTDVLCSGSSSTGEVMDRKFQVAGENNRGVIHWSHLREEEEEAGKQ